MEDIQTGKLASVEVGASGSEIWGVEMRVGSIITGDAGDDGNGADEIGADTIGAVEIGVVEIGVIEMDTGGIGGVGIGVVEIGDDDKGDVEIGDIEICDVKVFAVKTGASGTATVEGNWKEVLTGAWLESEAGRRNCGGPTRPPWVGVSEGIILDGTMGV